MWSKYDNAPFFNSFWATSKIFRGLFACVFQCKESKISFISKREKKWQVRNYIMLFFITPLLFENCWYPRVEEIMEIMRAYLRIRFWSMVNTLT